MPRLNNRKDFTTIDLFCGAGGITEGFRRAGFRCLYGNDIDAWAIKTFQENHPKAIADCRPVEKVNPKEIRRKLGLKKGGLTILVGGPPCQGFSINAPERFLDDPRNALFLYFMKFLGEFLPDFLLLENVPGMLSLADGKVFQQILIEIEKLGYYVSAKILFAAHYGVPQERWRLIILGSRKAPSPEHPAPSHFALRRANFRGGRTMVYKLSHSDIMALNPMVTVKDAIADLPKLRIGEGSEKIFFDNKPHSAYAREMRGSCDYTYNHFAGRLSSINMERLRYIKPGGSWRDIPFELLPEGMKRARRSDHTKRYGRLLATGLAATILTKCDPHWGPVFLPDQDRALTVREAARIQSFPDSYRFLGPRVAQYEQVGNAVPVLLAKAIARSLMRRIRKQNAQEGNP